MGLKGWDLRSQGKERFPNISYVQLWAAGWATGQPPIIDCANFLKSVYFLKIILSCDDWLQLNCTVLFYFLLRIVWCPCSRFFCRCYIIFRSLCFECSLVRHVFPSERCFDSHQSPALCCSIYQKLLQDAHFQLCDLAVSRYVPGRDFYKTALSPTPQTKQAASSQNFSYK